MTHLTRWLRRLRLPVLVLATLMLGDVCTACSSGLPTAKDLDAVKADFEQAKKQVADVKAKALRTSHQGLDKVASARTVAISVGALPADFVDWSGDVLTRARVLLERLERGERVTKEEVETTLNDVTSVVVELRKYGAQVDELVDSAIELAGIALAAT